MLGDKSQINIRLERAGEGNRSPPYLVAFGCINIGAGVALPCASVAATPAEAAGLGRIPGRAGRCRRVVSGGGGGGGGGVSDGRRSTTNTRTSAFSRSVTSRAAAGCRYVMD